MNLTFHHKPHLQAVDGLWCILVRSGWSSMPLSRAMVYATQFAREHRPC